MSIFANNLKRLRLSQGLTQTELGERIGVSCAMVSAMEKDVRKPSYEVLECIADYFNINMSELTGQSTPPLEMYKTWQCLTDENQKKVMSYMDFLISQQEIKIEFADDM